MNNEFTETRKLFLTLLNYDSTKPLNYDQWLAIPDDQKSAALYLNFYEQITLAWENTKSFYTPTSDGVSCVLQYLEKNVSRIKAEPKKYTARYIYRVAFNCLYCECHDKLCTRRVYENEVSESICVHTDNGQDFSFFDLMYDSRDDILDQIDSKDKDLQLQIFWDAIEQDVPTTVLMEKFFDVPNSQIIHHLNTKFGKDDYIIPAKSTLRPAMELVPKVISNVILDLLDPESDMYNPEFNLSQFKAALGY